MKDLLYPKARWHIAAWSALLFFELFLVSYYTDYQVDLPVGLWHYTLTIVLFYSNTWFLEQNYITSNKSQLGVTVTVILLQGTAYVLLNTWMFELLDYAGIPVRWTMSANWLIALAIWRAIFFMSMSTGYWALVWRIKSNKEMMETKGRSTAGKSVNIKETQDPDHMYINPGVKGKVIKVGYSDINYLEGLKNYIFIYTSETRYTTCLTLKEMETILPPGRFIRIHKSFIVNMDRIKSFEGTSVLLSQGAEVPVGGGYREAFLERIGQRMVKRDKAAL